MVIVIPEIPIKDKLTLTVPEASALAGIPYKIVNAAVKNGDLASCYAGRSTVRIRRTDLDDWVAALPLAAFAGQELDGFGKGLSVKLHDKINGIAALALAVSKPLVSPDGQAVMFFPAVFSSAFDKCLSLCAEKIFQTDGVCPVNLCLGVIHRDSSSFFCRVWGRFWSFCSSVRSLNRAAVSTHDLTFQRRCKSSLTALNSP